MYIIIIIIIIIIFQLEIPKVIKVRDRLKDKKKKIHSNTIQGKQTTLECVFYLSLLYPLL